MKTYLVALDSSPVAADVVATATEMAAKMGARLLLVRAVGIPVDLPESALMMSPSNVVGLLSSQAQKELERWLPSLPPALQAEVVVEVGTPWQVICDVAKARDVDLILLGAHGHNFLDRVLGTTTGRVVAHADRSVLVVWPSAHKK